jgi:hypothetical protein
LVSTLPSVDFLISIPDPYLEPFHQMAHQTWRLRRTNQVTLISEPQAVASWAQDNGKAGCFVAESSSSPSTNAVHQRPATLTPRYACVGEGRIERRELLERETTFGVVGVQEVEGVVEVDVVSVASMTGQMVVCVHDNNHTIPIDRLRARGYIGPVT